MAVAFLTVGEARAASRRAWGTRTAAESAVTKALSTPRTTDFDIFLSHSLEDAEIIAGVQAMLVEEGLSVYVDWMVDPMLDRSAVTVKTAQLLRKRMNHSRFLLFATSSTSPTSKWMPWELGYFDGKHPHHVGVLPLVQQEDATFRGQEYLGLYPVYEMINMRDHGRRIARALDDTHAELLKVAARR